MEAQVAARVGRGRCASEADQARLLRLGNLLGGSVLLLLVGLARWLSRRSSGGYKPRAASAEDSGADRGEVSA